MHLLERSEYVDYWSYKWSDLLLVSTRKLPQPAMWAFYRSIRQSVADNKPWDQFARDILLSNGNTIQQGGGNFFVLHKDTAELTESVSVTFLGMSVQCARCHNHPLEKWTQDQYWSMANLFSRVGLKNGERGDEVIVFEQPAGDVLHPRRNMAMPPTPLDGKPLALDDGRDRRVYFADWLTAADNPFFAKAVVNRVWRNFMGRGLVEAEDDLRETNPPSNRELFDALANDFVQNKYDVKRLIRQIMNSAAYQRSSKKVEGNEQDNRFYSRYLHPPAIGRSDSRLSLTSNRSADRLQSRYYQHRGRHGGDHQLPSWHARLTASRFARRLATSSTPSAGPNAWPLARANASKTPPSARPSC